METVRTTVLGYPRIGARRELKRATEDYWAGRIDAAALHQAAATLRRDTWESLRDAGIDLVPSHTFSFYDHVLDHAELFGAIPHRFAGLDGLDRYFAMARGTEGVPPLEMTKWFDTNYHYLVPELGPDTTFRTAGARSRPVLEYQEAAGLGVTTRPVLLGPLSFLLLAKPAVDTPRDFRPLDLLDPLLDAYVGLLDALADAGVEWVQLDEPALAADRDAAETVRAEDCVRTPGIDRTPAEADGGDVLRPDRDGPPAPGPHTGGRVRARPRGRCRRRGPDRSRRARRPHRGGRSGRRPQHLAYRPVPGHVRRGVPARLRRRPGDRHLLVVAARPARPHPGTRSDPPDCADRLAFARQKVDEVVLLGRALREGHQAVERELAEASAGTVAASDTVRRQGPGPARQPGHGHHPARLRRTAPDCRPRPEPAAAADHDDRLVPADRADPPGAGRPARRPDRPGRLRRADARRDRRGHRAAGGHRTGRARARRARTQRHGAVLRRAAVRLRQHDPRLGAVLRHPLRPATDPVRRRGPAGADDGGLDDLRPVTDRQARQGHADRAGHHAGLVLRARRPATGRDRRAGGARAARRDPRPGGGRHPLHPGRRARPA